MQDLCLTNTLLHIKKLQKQHKRKVMLETSGKIYLYIPYLDFLLNYLLTHKSIEQAPEILYTKYIREMLNYNKSAFI